jgi:integrase
VPREINRLNWKQVAGLREPGLYADGQGLYLRIDQTGARRWVYIFHQAGRRREMGLGSADQVKLADARQSAAAARETVRNGVDPIALRKAASLPPEEHSFAAAARSLLDDLAPGWKSPKQRQQWEASLQQHAPAIWRMDVAKVDTEAVLAALRPIWLQKCETASRVRGRIERVLDAAKVRGLRTGENPARWKGHLEFLLAEQPAERGHHAAMPYEEVPAFMLRLAERNGISALALRLLILTATRSAEVLGARAEEVDLGARTWTVPAERVKGRRASTRPHRVMLSDAAVEVVKEAMQAGSEWLFPGLDGHLSSMALEMQMRKMGVQGATPHGFRSSFKDWASDCTDYADETSEEALGHVIGSRARRAYRRRQAEQKLRGLMGAWGDYCTGRAGQVIALPSRG